MSDEQRVKKKKTKKRNINKDKGERKLDLF